MIVVIIAPDEETGCTLVLSPWSGTSGTPAASYPMGEVQATVYQSADITGLSGEWQVRMVNIDSEPVYTGYVVMTGEAQGHATSEPSNAAEVAELVIDGLDSVTINRISPYNPLTRNFVLIQDDDYVHANGTHVDIDLVEPTVNLSTSTATVTARAKLASSCDSFSGVATIVAGTPNKLRIEWPNAGSGRSVGEYTWQAKVVDSATNKKTHFEGLLTLKRSTDG